MAGSVLMGFAGPQDLVYGFSPKNVAERLTSENWRRKAVMRQDKHGELYIWVSRGKKEEDGKKRMVHSVSVERPLLVGDRRTIYGRFFDGLEDALRYANGEDRSALSRNSRPLGRMILNELGVQLLGGKPAPTTFSVMGTGHQVEIPGAEDDGDPVKPDEYACFLTEVLESILEVSPGMSKYVYKYGISLHPDVEGRKSYGPKSDLPERITVRCYRTEKEVVGKFHVFPKERAAGGLMRAVRIDGPKGQAGKRALTAGKKALPKGQARS
jgi:hypothetical protein